MMLCAGIKLLWSCLCLASRLSLLLILAVTCSCPIKKTKINVTGCSFHNRRYFNSCALVTRWSAEWVWHMHSNTAEPLYKIGQRRIRKMKPYMYYYICSLVMSHYPLDSLWHYSSNVVYIHSSKPWYCILLFCYWFHPNQDFNTSCLVTGLKKWLGKCFVMFILMPMSPDTHTHYPPVRFVSIKHLQ